MNIQPVLVNCAPAILLFASEPHKDFIDVEGITILSVPTLPPTGAFSSELDAPESDGLLTDCDASLSQ